MQLPGDSGVVERQNSHFHTYGSRGAPGKRWVAGGPHDMSRLFSLSLSLSSAPGGAFGEIMH